MRFLTPFFYLFALIAIVVAGIVLWVGVSFHQFAAIEPAGDLRCTPVVGLYGAADIEPVPDTAAAWISSLDRRGEASRGALLRFDTANPLDDGSWRDRTGGRPSTLEPMGIDLWSGLGPNGEAMSRLFVVNLAGPEVLIYDIEANGDLRLFSRLADAQLVSPNDVVATGPTSFYVTNDTASGRDSIKGKIDFLLGLQTGQILHYDGNSWSSVASGLAFPNGLALSEDGEMLILAEMRAKRLRRYSRDAATDAITLSEDIHLSSFPDNLFLAEDGELVVGTVPQPLSFTAYGEGLREVAPSSILSLGPLGETRTLFQDPGHVLSAATVGVRLGNKLLIGSRAADRILMCNTASQQAF